MAWYREYGGFPPAQAREVKGGIKSQSRRGGFGQSWWAKRWIELIESFGLGTRLTRGRAASGGHAHFLFGEGVAVTAPALGHHHHLAEQPVGDVARRPFTPRLPYRSSQK